MLISSATAAARLGITSRRVRELIKQKRLPAQLVGSQWVINENDLVLVQERKPGRPKKS